jgi:hypothetical protein
MVKSIYFLFGTVCLIWANFSYSYCVETRQGDGSLSPGVMPSSVCQSLLSTLQQQQKGTYMFRVQNNGYYGKLCNEPNQINHFMSAYAHSKGSWSCSQTNTPCSSLEENGVYRVEVQGDTYTLCTYN